LKTLIEILNLSTDHLKNKGVDEPRLSAELIISGALGIKRLDIYLQFDRELNEDEICRIRNYLGRRSGHEPIQYILGETEFYGLKFKVDTSVLIPRPDTEILVEKAACLIGDRMLNIIEIGTGSGCIAVSLAHKCKNIKITATDNSDEALVTAKKNAELNKVADRILFIKQDILKEIPKENYDVVVSNPPYISKNVLGSLNRQVKDFEPLGALTDGEDGLTFYKRINQILPQILKNCGSVLLEIGYDQADQVRSICEKSLENIEITRDLNGNPRVLTGVNKN
jgi:release factor glutamine methyltransferase